MQTQVVQTSTDTASGTPPGTPPPTATATATPSTAKPTDAAVPGSPPSKPDSAKASAATASAEAKSPGQDDASQPTATTRVADVGHPDTNAAPSEDKPKRTVSELLGLPPTDRELQGGNDAIAEDTVLLAYQLVLWGGRQEVVRLKSQLELQLALAEENLPLTELSFPEMLERVITRPLVTRFRSFLQGRFDAISRAKAAAAEPPPQPASPGMKPTELTKPANSKPFVMPAIDVRPHYPKPPGWSTNSKPEG